MFSQPHSLEKTRTAQKHPARMALQDYIELLPDYIGRKPAEYPKVLKDVSDKLEREIDNDGTLQIVLGILNQQTALWKDADLQSLRAAAHRGLHVAEQRRKQGQTQDYQAFLAYLPESLWKQIHACYQDYNVAILLASFLTRLGLRNPSEQSTLKLTAFVLAVSKADHSKDQPEDLHRMFLSMKKLLKSIIASAKTPMSKPPWMPILPAAPELCNRLWLHEGLGVEQPMAQPPISNEMLAYHAGRVQMRKSSKALGSMYRDHPTSAGGSACSSGDSNPWQMMGDVMKLAMHIVAQNRAGEPTQAKIQLLTSPRKKELLAIEDVKDKNQQLASGVLDTAPRSLLGAFESIAGKPENQEASATHTSSSAKADAASLQQSLALQAAMDERKQNAGVSPKSKGMKRPASKMASKTESDAAKPGLKRPAAAVKSNKKRYRRRCASVLRERLSAQIFLMRKTVSWFLANIGRAII